MRFLRLEITIDVRVSGVQIVKCPVCGQPGSIHLKYSKCGKPGCRCRSGQLHGPRPVVEHYVGYDAKKKRSKTRSCYLNKTLLESAENQRMRAFLVAWGVLEKQHRESIAGLIERKLGRRRGRRPKPAEPQRVESISEYVKEFFA